MKRYVAKGRPDSPLKAARRLRLKAPRKVVAFAKRVVQEILPPEARRLRAAMTELRRGRANICTVASQTTKH